MSDGENIDVDEYATREEAVQAAIDACCDAGDKIVVCRGAWATCAAVRQGTCDFCARIPWVPGLTAADVLARAAAN